MRERTHRRIYIAHGLLFGLPALLAGGLVAGFGVYTFLTRSAFMRGDEGTVLFLWSAAGLAGLVGWLWLSVCYLRQGRAALRHTRALPWIGLALGGLAALGVVGYIGFAWATGSPWQVLGYLLLGPPLLVPAAHLAWLRWGATDAV